MTNRVRSVTKLGMLEKWIEVIKVERMNPEALVEKQETSVLILLKPPKDLGISGNRVPLEAGVEPDAKNGKNG